MAEIPQEPEWVPGSAKIGDDGADIIRRKTVFDQQAVSQVNWADLKRELIKAMKDPKWDDGSWGPILIRLAWHSSGTYDAATNTGGTYNGASMRFEPEMNDPENAGLKSARDFLEPFKKKFNISYADLWVFAAYTFIEYSGGPTMRFTAGRVDATQKEIYKGSKKEIKPGRLPGAGTGLAPLRGGKKVWLDDEGRVKGWENLAQHLRDVFGRMGVSDQELVALLCGGHVYGRCHPTSSGYAGPWVAEMTKFSNEYAADMIEDDWICVTHEDDWLDELGFGQVRPAKGKRQYVNIKKPPSKAPPASGFQLGIYKLTGDKWCNMRKTSDTKATVIARPENGAEFNIVFVKTFGTAVRGQVDSGGWVSIVASGGTVLFERTGDLALTSGKFVAPGKQKTYSAPDPKTVQKTTITGPFEVAPPKDADGGDSSSAFDVKNGDIFGHTEQGYVQLVSRNNGVLCQRILPGINDSDEVKKFEDFVQIPQMMLVSDMVLLWDEGFKKYLEMYAENEKKLKTDFGAAFKKLTELGQSSELIGCPVAH